MIESWGKSTLIYLRVIILDSPSPPVNLTSAVRLDWDPPLNDGGAAITNYLIFVNMSQQVVSTDTTTTLTLNSTGQHLIEISAVNFCGSSVNTSKIIYITGTIITTILVTHAYN